MICPVCEKIEVYIDSEAEVINPACLMCWLTGRYFEWVLCGDDRQNVLARIREIESVVEARCIHVDEGAFTLMIQFNDGRIIRPEAYVGSARVIEITEEGAKETKQEITAPMIPPAGASWILTVMRPNVVSSNDDELYESTRMPDVVDDAGLYNLIKEIAP